MTGKEVKVVFTLAISVTFMLALLSATPCSSGSPSQRQSWPVEKLPTRSPTAADIEFADFEFQLLAIGRHGPSPTSISGQPLKAGTKYFVQPKLYGTEAIATAKFEAVDEHGAVLAVIPMLQRSSHSDAYFFGLMLIPDRPFRVMVSGQAVEGSRYKRTFKSLFVPSSGHDTKPEDAKEMRAILEAMNRQELLDIEGEFAKLPDGTIVMPRARIFNVNYAPLFSPSGQPLGLRITYEVEFSKEGYYNPELKMYPDFENEEWRGLVGMEVLNGSIKPEPRAESPKSGPHPLAFGADYNYRANTTYHFTAEFVPDYVIRNEQKTKFCLYDQKYDYDPKARAVWKAILASKEPITYRVYIQNSDFAGIIEKFYSHHELYNSFVALGAVDCGPQPYAPVLGVRRISAREASLWLRAVSRRRSGS